MGGAKSKGFASTAIGSVRRQESGIMIRAVTPLETPLNAPLYCMQGMLGFLLNHIVGKL